MAHKARHAPSAPLISIAPRAPAGPLKPPQVTGAAIMTHLQALEDIAYRPENQGSRATFTGYNASVDYVVATLSANTDFQIVIQTLPVSLPSYVVPPTLALVAPEAATFSLDTDFLGYNYGATGDVSARTQVRTPARMLSACSAHHMRSRRPRGPNPAVVTGTPARSRWLRHFRL